ncbi:MAG: ribonuclease P protein component [Gemmatimonadota bacterium]|nr:ribonuclease P protein component [Gemmatimonadota bacterium]
MAREGKRIRTEHLELRASASPRPHPRVGFIVPKHGASGVERNRLKRRLREIIRLYVLPTLPPLDLVVRTRREAYAASVPILTSELVRGTERLASDSSIGTRQRS